MCRNGEGHGRSGFGDIQIVSHRRSVIIAGGGLHYGKWKSVSSSKERQLTTGTDGNIGSVGGGVQERAERTGGEIFGGIVGGGGDVVGSGGVVDEIAKGGVFGDADGIEPYIDCVGHNNVGIVIAGDRLGRCEDKGSIRVITVLSKTR